MEKLENWDIRKVCLLVSFFFICRARFLILGFFTVLRAFYTTKTWKSFSAQSALTSSDLEIICNERVRQNSSVNKTFSTLRAVDSVLENKLQSTNKSFWNDFQGLWVSRVNVSSSDGRDLRIGLCLWSHYRSKKG